MFALALLLGAGPLHKVKSEVKVEGCTYKSGWFDPNKRPGPGIVMPDDPPPPPAPPPPSYRVLVRKGLANTDVKPVVELTTEPGGAFTVELPPGDYCAVTEVKRRAHLANWELPYGADAKCLRKRRTTCDAVWKVRDADLAGAPVREVSFCAWEDLCFPKRPPGPPVMN